VPADEVVLSRCQRARSSRRCHYLASGSDRLPAGGPPGTTAHFVPPTAGKQTARPARISPAAHTASAHQAGSRTLAWLIASAAAVATIALGGTALWLRHRKPRAVHDSEPVTSGSSAKSAGPELGTLFNVDVEHRRRCGAIVPDLGEPAGVSAPRWSASAAAATSPAPSVLASQDAGGKADYLVDISTRNAARQLGTPRTSRGASCSR
jgi:hypothetical protein